MRHKYAFLLNSFFNHGLSSFRLLFLRWQVKVVRFSFKTSNALGSDILFQLSIVGQVSSDCQLQRRIDAILLKVLPKCFFFLQTQIKRQPCNGSAILSFLSFNFLLNARLSVLEFVMLVNSGENVFQFLSAAVWSMHLNK